MTNQPVAAFSIPILSDLLGAIAGPLVDLGASIAGSVLGEVIQGLTSAVIGALVDMVASILAFFWDASEPQPSAPWFSGPDTPYKQLVLLAAPLLVAFAFAGIIQGSLKGDTGGMLRMMLLRLPGAVLGMSMTVAVTDVLLRVTDEMSRVMLSGFEQDVTKIGTVLSAMGNLAGPSLGTLLLLLLFGFIGLLGAVVVVIQLFVRSALIYLVAALSPLVFAASVWEPMRGGVRKLAEVGFALIISKLVIAVALAVAAAAMAGSWDAAEVTELTTPEFTAGQAEISVTERIGIILTGSVMFIVAAFMPWITWRLLPLAEGALVSSGVAGGPLRAWQSGSSTVNSLANNPAVSELRSARAAKQASMQRGKGTETQQTGGTDGGRQGASRKAKQAAASAGKGGGRQSAQPGSPEAKRSPKPGAGSETRQKPASKQRQDQRDKQQGASPRRTPAKQGGGSPKQDRREAGSQGKGRPQPRRRTFDAGREVSSPGQGRSTGRRAERSRSGNAPATSQDPDRKPQAAPQRPKGKRRPGGGGDKR